mmetsp:Transcript_11996/g.28155  ORF Transcript_11996/g.28155 Transcript_11996/m.28155 type:complete len:147 (+) Transcript_11996:1146-1586(+)
MSCQLINDTVDMRGVHGIFHRFATSILSRAEKARRSGFDDPTHDRTTRACRAIVELTETEAKRSARKSALVTGGAAVVASCATAGFLSLGSGTRAASRMPVTSALASFGMFSLMKAGLGKCVGSRGAMGALLPAEDIVKRSKTATM